MLLAKLSSLPLCVRRPRGMWSSHGGAPSRVVITAAGRSGSTLLQSAFIASCDALTFFEPCRHSPEGDVRQERCSAHVRRFLSCDFPAKHGTWDPPTIRGWLKSPYHDVNSCPRPPFESVEHTAAACRTSRLLVVKEIRLVGQLHRLVSSLETLAAHSNPTVIIQLVRDPRAMLASQKRLNWWRLRGQEDPATSNEILGRVAKRTCRGMLADARTGRRVDHRGAFVYAMVRFEELAANLTLAVEHLHDQLGWRVPLSTHLWLQRTAHGHCDVAAGSSPKEVEYSTCRNSTAATRTHWREALTRREQRTVTKRCYAALQHFGYLGSNVSEVSSRRPARGRHTTGRRVPRETAVTHHSPRGTSRAR